MFTVNPYDNTIKTIQGNTGILELALDNYFLQEGDRVFLTVKSAYDSKKALIFKEVDKFEDGKAKIIFTTTDTNLDVGKYIYDVRCDLSDGRVDTVITQAKFQISGGITDV